MADMSERTMWKDDVHGHLLRASLVDLENRDSEDEVMRTLREKKASHDLETRVGHVCLRPRVHRSSGGTVSECTLNDEAAPSDP